MSKILAELARGMEILRAAEDEGAGGEAEAKGGTDEAPAANDSANAGAADDSKPAGASETKPATPPSADWRDRRIAQLTAQKAQLAQKLNSPPKPQALDPTADFEARVAAQAAAQADALVAIRTFNERCNAEVDKGREEFGAGEFNASISGLQQLVDSQDPASVTNYQDFIESALETGSGAALLFELGKDLNEAERILSLSPKRRAIELARKADLVGKPSEPSRAPKPIRPVESRGARHEEIKASDAEKADRLSTADWMARRNAEVAAQAGRR